MVTFTTFSWSSKASSDETPALEGRGRADRERAGRACREGRGWGRAHHQPAHCSAPAPYPAAFHPPSLCLSCLLSTTAARVWITSPTPESLSLLTGQTGVPPAGGDGPSLPQGSSQGRPCLDESLLLSLRGQDTYVLPELCRILLKYFLPSQRVLCLSTRRQAVGLGPS